LSVSTSNLPPLPHPPAQPRPSTTAAWKNEVTARVRAHRNGRVPEQPMLPGMEIETAPTPDSAGKIAARVAERYARVPSWREAMAADAAAQAAAAAPPAPPVKPAAVRRPRPVSPRTAASDRPASPNLAPSLPHGQPVPPSQPDLIRYSVSSDSLPTPRSTPAEARVRPAPHPAAQPEPGDIFDPLEEAIVEPTRLLPARVIEFPRELIAPRKARPRLAEGPLYDDQPREKPALSAAPAEAASREVHQPECDDPLLLEADPKMSRHPPFESDPQTDFMPEWQSIHLDSEESVSVPKSAARSPFLDDASLHVAPIEDRLMAGVVDVALTLAAFLLFVLVFAACSTHAPTGRPALIGAGIALLAMGVLYQIIFFSLSAATPGMRYARIALCTFDDENPTRRTMRARIAALLLSALPLGLGFLWAVFDEDALGWHDRITQTYQRSYRES
jgi:uncharacterized RDD family membrane protein YckC